MPVRDDLALNSEGLINALERVRMLVSAVGVNGEHIVDRLHDMIAPLQHARTVLASMAPDDPDAERLRDALAIAIRTTTEAATRSLQDLERARRLLALGADALLGDSEPSSSGRDV